MLQIMGYEMNMLPRKLKKAEQLRNIHHVSIMIKTNTSPGEFCLKNPQESDTVVLIQLKLNSKWMQVFA